MTDKIFNVKAEKSQQSVGRFLFGSHNRKNELYSSFQGRTEPTEFVDGDDGIKLHVRLSSIRDHLQPNSFHEPGKRICVNRLICCATPVWNPAQFSFGKRTNTCKHCQSVLWFLVLISELRFGSHSTLSQTSLLLYDRYGASPFAIDAVTSCTTCSIAESTSCLQHKQGR